MACIKNFFGVLKPSFLDYMIAEFSDSCPSAFVNYDPKTENPVIAFCKVARKGDLDNQSSR
ncbi:MAG: hypothetical protein ACK5L5_10740 [Bacteroidales bacterium]